MKRNLPRRLCVVLGLVALTTASATTPGPTRIIQCPGSEEIRQVPSINSGNTFGATFWTDGYFIAPMLPQFPPITRCSDDGPIFWVSSAKVVGELPAWPEDSASAPPAVWRSAPAVRKLKGEEFLQAVDQGLGDTAAKLVYLRRQAWWEANHTRRSPVLAPDAGAPAATSDFAEGTAARANLEALIAALDVSDPSQLLIRIEGLRELGRFDEAGELLKSDKLSEARLQPWVSVIKERVRLRDARVAKLRQER